MSAPLQTRAYEIEIYYHAPGHAPYDLHLECTLIPAPGATYADVKAEVAQEAAIRAGIEPDKVIVDNFRIA